MSEMNCYSTAAEVMNAFSRGDITEDKATELISNLKKEKKGKIALKVSQKGAIQINGIRRFPITLYVQEMEKILALANSGELASFIKDNESELVRK